MFKNDPNGWNNDKWWKGLALTNKRWNQEFKDPLFPVKSVNWYTAVAYTRWLSEKLEYEVRLPTEKEWLEVAKPYKEGIYPWGNEWHGNLLNSIESNIHKPVVVDRFPKGKSRYGVYDMLGNVGEWCLNEQGGEVRMESGAWKLIKGGSYLEDCKDGVSMKRYASAINTFTNCGFRIVYP